MQDGEEIQLKFGRSTRTLLKKCTKNGDEIHVEW